jgi:hypothetical protein
MFVVRRDLVAIDHLMSLRSKVTFHMMIVPFPAGVCRIIESDQTTLKPAIAKTQQGSKDAIAQR